MKRKSRTVRRSAWIRKAVLGQQQRMVAHCLSMREKVHDRVRMIAAHLESLPEAENEIEDTLKKEVLRNFRLLQLGLDRFWRTRLQKGHCQAFHEDLEDRVRNISDSGSVVRLYYPCRLYWEGMHLFPFLFDQIWSCLAHPPPEWLRLEIDLQDGQLTLELRYQHSGADQTTVTDLLCGRDIHFLFSALGAQIQTRQGLSGSRVWRVRFIWKDLCAFSSVILAPSMVLD